MKLIKSLVSAAFAVALVASANAVTIGGINFDDNAFADVLQSSSGSFTTSGGSLSSVLTDTDPGTYAFSFSPGAFVQLGFTDNVVVNGAGNDLALFELGIPDTFSLTIGGITQIYATTFTGFVAGGFDLNVAVINLDDFGLASQAEIDSILVGLDIVSSSGTVPSFSLAGAINSGGANVPDGGATIALLGVSLAVIAGLRRKLCA